MGYNIYSLRGGEVLPITYWYLCLSIVTCLSQGKQIKNSEEQLQNMHAIENDINHRVKSLHDEQNTLAKQQKAHDEQVHTYIFVEQFNSCSSVCSTSRSCPCDFM